MNLVKNLELLVELQWVLHTCKKAQNFFITATLKNIRKNSILNPQPHKLWRLSEYSADALKSCGGIKSQNSFMDENYSFVFWRFKLENILMLRFQIF